jgi:hypothetical protein
MLTQIIKLVSSYDNIMNIIIMLDRFMLFGVVVGRSDCLAY